VDLLLELILSLTRSPQRTACREFDGNRYRIGEREGASQAVFVRYLNVTTGLVSQWERGEKHPQGASLKLLALIPKFGLNGVA
jgi:DNA-binding transcriptional regulator YiaG